MNTHDEQRDLEAYIIEHHQTLSAALGWDRQCGMEPRVSRDVDDRVIDVRLFGPVWPPLHLGHSIEEARKEVLRLVASVPEPAGDGTPAGAPELVAVPLWVVEFPVGLRGVGRWWCEDRHFGTNSLADASLFSEEEADKRVGKLFPYVKAFPVAEVIAEAERDINERREDLAALQARVAAGGDA